MTSIVKCTCDHEFQDKEYGLKNRVVNSNEKGDKGTCTVCKKEHSVNIKK